MRIPSSWRDKALIEEDPLASLFLARKFTRSRRGDGWITELAKGIQSNPTQLASATQWITYAFTPEDNLTRAADVLPSTIKMHTSLDLLELFVRFYWTWYAVDERAALVIVNQQRKKRGFVSLLQFPKKAQVEDGLSSGNTVVSTSPAIQSAPVPVSGRALVSQGETVVNEEPVIDPVTLGVAQVGAKSTQIHHSGGNPHPFNGVTRMSEPGTLRTLDIQVSEPAAVTEDDVPLSPLTEIDEDNPDYSAFDNELEPVQRSPREPQQPAVQSSVSGSHSAASVDTSIPLAKNGQHKQKKARAERPAGSLRQRMPRKATNTERISDLAQKEFVYHDKLKRGHLNDAEFERPTDLGNSGTLESAVHDSQHTKKKSRKSKASLTTLEPPGLVTSLVASTAPPESQDPIVVDTSPTVESSVDISRAQPPHSTLAKRSKKSKAPTTRKKLMVPDDTSRPSKRRRNLEDVSDAFGALNDAVRQHRTSTQGGVQDSSKTVSTPVGSHIDSSVANDRKRNRSVPSTGAIESDMQPQMPRKAVKLPQRRSVRKRLTDIVPRVPPAEVLGIPANLEEEDRFIRDIATEALLDMHRQPKVTEEWVDDAGAQDDPPSSDDEEDIPLSVALASKTCVPYTSASASSPFEDEVIPLGVTAATKDSGAGYQHIPVASTLPSFSGVSSLDHRGPGIAHLFATCRTIDPGPDCAPISESSRSALPFASCDALPSAAVPRIAHVQDPELTPPTLPAKKPLTTQPIIWAESRQEVCESFDWFRSYQGGVYFNNDMVKGYLLSAFSASRDLFARDGRLIVSHGGGKAESIHSKNGQSGVQEAGDQREEDKSVRALLRTYQMRRPLVLIIDDRYALFPYDLAEKGYTYVVLGFYHIAHVWAERQSSSNGKGFVIRYKFAFEWCQRQPDPWWLRSPTGEVPLDKTYFPAGTYMCPVCVKASPLVYQKAWMCLQPHCPSFWTCINGTRPPETLTYDERFLNSSFHCNHEMLEDIAPLPPAIGAADGVVTSRRFCKGWHCKNCGRLSCRYKWEHWECKSCGTTLQVSGKTRVPNEFWSQTNPDFMHHKLSSDSGIIVSQMRMYRTGNSFSHYHIYTLPQNRGHIYLILGRKLVNQTADEIFQEYQEQAGSGELRFRRWPLRSHQCRGTLLTNYFSQNTGEPYQYVGGTANTVPFEGAPSAVVKARDLIQARMASVIQAERQQYLFNEVLSAAYMEKQKMAFHSDAERGLGPRVASLSLGSSAYMHFRVLKKYRDDKSSGASQNILTLFLRHGDILIMDGAAIQEYYEHTVVPLNFRIAATARYIGAQ